MLSEFFAMKNRFFAGMVLALFLVTCITGCSHARQSGSDAAATLSTGPDEVSQMTETPDSETKDLLPENIDTASSTDATSSSDSPSSKEATTTTEPDEEGYFFPRETAQEAPEYEIYEVDESAMDAKLKEKISFLNMDSEAGFEWEYRCVGWELLNDCFCLIYRFTKIESDDTQHREVDTLMFAHKWSFDGEFMEERLLPVAFRDCVTSGPDTIVAREYIWNVEDEEASIAVFYEIDLYDYTAKELFSIKTGEAPDLEFCIEDRLYFTQGGKRLSCYDLAGEEKFCVEAPAKNYGSSCQWFVLDDSLHVFYLIDSWNAEYARCDGEGNLIGISGALYQEEHRRYRPFGDTLIMFDNQGLWDMDEETMTWRPILKWNSIPFPADIEDAFPDGYSTGAGFYTISDDKEKILVSQEAMNGDWYMDRLLILVRK